MDKMGIFGILAVVIGVIFASMLVDMISENSDSLIASITIIVAGIVEMILGGVMIYHAHKMKDQWKD